MNLYNNIFFDDTASSLFFSTYSGGQINNNLFSGGYSVVSIGYHWGTLYNNIIQNAASTALWNAALSENPLDYGYNLLWNNVADYNDRFDPGVGDVYGNPMLNLVTGYLENGSPAIDAGNPLILDLDSSRSDIGPFGGPWAYEN